MTYFITGTDTGIGKTHVTAHCAKYLLSQNRNVITMKVVQTGCTGMAEDILTHRAIMEMSLTRSDREGITCPYVFPFAASPHYASRRAGISIDCEKISTCVKRLSSEYDYVLVEGAGGILSPITETVTMLDFAIAHSMPLIVVFTPKVGSINHTMLTISEAHKQNAHIHALVYNCHGSHDQEITESTREYIQKRVTIPIVTLTEKNILLCAQNIFL